MKPYTIEWDMERNGGVFPPEHTGLCKDSCKTTISSTSIIDFKKTLLTSLGNTSRMSNKWDITPLGCGKVVLERTRGEMYIGWIEIGGGVG